MSENIVKSSKQKLSDYFRDRAKNGMPPEYQNVVVDRDRLFAAAIELDKLRADFKNFHRLLCERFDYDHDEIDWERDQLSLIEWIAQRRQDEAAGQRICLGCGEPYPCASDCPAGTAIPVKVAADETSARCAKPDIHHPACNCLERESRDAERYRFIRQPGNAIVYAKDRSAWGNGASGHVRYDTAEQLDAAVDAARAPVKATAAPRESDWRCDHCGRDNDPAETHCGQCEWSRKHTIAGVLHERACMGSPCRCGALNGEGSREG